MISKSNKMNFSHFFGIADHPLCENLFLFPIEF